MSTMQEFYFTYGLAGQPFIGGWSIIEAPSMSIAVDIFRAIHPDRTEGLLNCAMVYSKGAFEQTRMAVDGNLGSRCHEHISWWRAE